MNYVSGASGFLGSHLVKQLTDVVAIPHEDIAAALPLRQFDNFFFVSAYGNLASQTDDTQICKANLIDLISIIKQAVTFDFKSFVYISTSSVKLKNQTMYSRTKRAAEEILLAFMEKYNKPICIIRPLSITGVGEQREHLIPTLIRSCLTNERINLVIPPTHDFIDVQDVVAGILSLSEHRARGIYELGTGIKHSNGDVLNIVQSVTGGKANANLVPNMRAYDNDDWVSTNFKARSYGWLPKKTLHNSIEEMVKEYKK